MIVWQSMKYLNANLIYILVATFLIWLTKFYWSRRHLYRLVANMDSPRSFPIIGHTLIALGTMEDQLKKLISVFAVHKSPIKLWLGFQLTIALTKPEHIEIVLNHPKALGKSYIYKFSMLTCGLTACPVNMWKKHRKIISHVFNTKILKSHISIFNENSNILIDKLENEAGKGVFDIYPYVSRCNLDTLYATNFGIPLNSQNNPNCGIVHALNNSAKLINLRFVKPWYHSELIYRLSGLKQKTTAQIEYFQRVCDEIIYQKKEEFHKRLHKVANLMENKKSDEEYIPQSKSNTFLDLLIELTEEQQLFTHEELQHEVMTFIFGGVETSSTVMSYTLMMLGMHPEIQEKLFAEVDEILDSSHPKISYDELSQMHYMDMVINESMRVLPMAPFILRHNTEDIKLDEDKIIPANSACIISIINVHRDPKLWPDPMRFDPERFSPDQDKLRHPYSFIPFSAGPRNCIGYKYALYSLKTVIATIVKNYIITCPLKTPSDIRVKLEISLKPIPGHIISIKKRTQVTR